MIAYETTHRRWWAIAVFALVGATTSIACRPRPVSGSPCRVPDQLICAASGKAFVCDVGTWQEIACRGPRGCARRGAADECDDTRALEGDRCPRNPPPDYACTSDRAKALVCKDGRFAAWRSCRGPEACRIVGDRNLHCDTTLGMVGDICGQQGTYACAVDQKGMLVCDGSSFVLASSCRGPQGCHIERESRKVDCDDAIALEGDPCDQPKRIACTSDAKTELVCDGRKFTKKRECRRKGCSVSGAELFCD